MKKLLIVSNRLPVTIQKKDDTFNFKPSVGGLATGLSSFYKKRNSKWIGWGDIPPSELNSDEKQRIKEKLSSNYDSYPVFLPKEDVDRYYYGFCNKTIWPLFHGFTQYAVYDKGLWTSYKRVNKKFANTIAEIAETGDTIWIHDYHLLILPRLLREKLEDATIGFFLHTPFPPCEVFRLLPWRKEILDSLLNSDLIGFHTYTYVQNFLSAIRRLRGYEHTLGRIRTDSRIVKVDSFPMGIDYDRFTEITNKPEVKKEIKEIRKEIETKKTIFSIDRLDYTKGIPQRLEAFDLFLEKYPEYKEKVTLILSASPSRTRVEQYKTLKREVDELISKINGRHGTIGWRPIWYIYRFLPFQRLAALYAISDIALITPLKDGMNLISKEFIASKQDGEGVLILSEMAGASKELSEALIVNPNNKEQVAEAIKEALEMPYEEQVRRNQRMQNRLKNYNVTRWAKDFISELSKIKKNQEEIPIRILTYQKERKLINDYQASDHRLILLDYDGTLVPLMGKPEEAKPDEEILNLLKELTRDGKNEVVMVSGRKRETLEKWFKNLDVGLIAEHGAWTKERGEEDWETLKALKKDWKDEIRPILELYTDRTPNSFIEEKHFSFTWHYRKVDSELASERVRELKDALLDLTSTLEPPNLGVFKGNKVIEIKQADVNKGQAALKWLSKKWDFILAMGDDWTDEDLFTACPNSAYTIKIGMRPSEAEFNIKSVKNARELLEKILSSAKSSIKENI